jgi:hypothetical protein
MQIVRGKASRLVPFALEMGHDASAKLNERLVRQVILCIVGPPRANLKVRRSKTITNVVDRREKGERRLILTAPLLWLARCRIGLSMTSPALRRMWAMDFLLSHRERFSLGRVAVVTRADD